MVGLERKAMLEASERSGRNWVLVESLSGGFNEGALLVRDDHGERAVLKVTTRHPDRVMAARSLVDRAIAAGWPTPAWRDMGRVGDAVWVLQDYIEGTPPRSLGTRQAEGFMAAFEVQRGLGPGGVAGWGEWAAGVVFEDWEGYRARAVQPTEAARMVVDRVDEIARRCAGCPVLAGTDLVHGNAGTVNAIDDGTTLWLVDTITVGPGPVAYDLAELILSSACQPGTDPGAIEQLWQWAAARVDPRHVAVCAGSVALTLVDAHHRLSTGADLTAVSVAVAASLDAALGQLD